MFKTIKMNIWYKKYLKELRDYLDPPIRRKPKTEQDYLEEEYDYILDKIGEVLERKE